MSVSKNDGRYRWGSVSDRNKPKRYDMAYTILRTLIHGIPHAKLGVSLNINQITVIGCRKIRTGLSQ